MPDCEAILLAYEAVNWSSSPIQLMVRQQNAIRASKEAPRSQVSMNQYGWFTDCVKPSPSFEACLSTDHALCGM